MRPRVGMILVLLAALALAAYASPGPYSITPVGFLPGGTQSYAQGINSSNQVSGISWGSGVWTAIVWDNGVRTPLPTPPGTEGTYADKGIAERCDWWRRSRRVDLLLRTEGTAQKTVFRKFQASVRTGGWVTDSSPCRVKTRELGIHILVDRRPHVSDDMDTKAN